MFSSEFMAHSAVALAMLVVVAGVIVPWGIMFKMYTRAQRLYERNHGMGPDLDT